MGFKSATIILTKNKIAIADNVSYWLKSDDLEFEEREYEDYIRDIQELLAKESKHFDTVLYIIYMVAFLLYPNCTHTIAAHYFS